MKNISILFILCISINTYANAANTVEIKKQIDPGAIDTYSKEQKFWTEQTKNKTNEEVQIDSELEKETTAKINSESNIQFELKGVEFAGNTVIPTKDLNRFFEPLIDQEVGFNQIINKISEITQIYQLMGYITSKAYIPPQKIENGIIKINLLEGKIGQIDVNKTRWAKNSYIKSHLIQPNNIQESKILNVNNLKTALNEINNKEYLKGKVTLRRGDVSESTDIVFDVKDRFPLNLSPTWDNFGRDYTGIQRAGINIANQNVTGFGDTLSSGLDFSTGVFGVNTEYSIPLGSKGAELQLGYSHSDVKIGQELKPQNIKGKSSSFKPKIILPLYKKNNLKLTSDIAYEMLSSKTESSYNAGFNNKYELRALRTGLNLLKEDTKGRWLSRMEVSTGLPILGATTTKEDYSDPTSKFVKLEGNLTRVQQLPLNSYGIFKLSGQYSHEHLLAAEQMQAGGMYSVRGFKEGLLSGDIGYNLVLEIRKPVPYLPKDLPIHYWKDKIVKIPLKDRIFFSVFYDQVLAREVKQKVPYTYKNFLQSVGAGLNISLTKYLNANMYVGVPIGRQRNDTQNSARFHFGISSDLI